ncbi:MAG: hypothetical protein HY081_01035 [Gammaproteobacteria bacterium]|nr:hypothetical protein [Gammaproteobacteria bacterium]
MKVELTEISWRDAQQVLSLAQLAELSGLRETELRELVDCGVIDPIDRDAGEPSFRADCIFTMQTARRLHKDFELDAHGLTLALALLNRIQDLETQLSELRVQQPRRPRKKFLEE